MKNKLPKPTRRGQTISLESIDTKIDMIIAYLQEKEDISKSLEEELKNLEMPNFKHEIIKVPEDVIFHKPIGNRNESLGLINHKQQLYYSFDDNIWHVGNNNNSKPIPMQLVKCNYDDIEVGDFFYSNDSEDLSKIHELEYYSLKLGENYMYWRGNDILSSEYQFKNYYKITPIQ